MSGASASIATNSLALDQRRPLVPAEAGTQADFQKKPDSAFAGMSGDGTARKAIRP
jgi:hypothetical protein